VKRIKFDFSDNLVKMAKKYGFAYLGVFGSAARGEMNDKSDVDLLVRFEDDVEIGLFGLVKIEQELENQIGRGVDLVTKLNKYVEPYVKKDLVTVYGKRFAGVEAKNRGYSWK